MEKKESSTSNVGTKSKKKSTKAKSKKSSDALKKSAICEAVTFTKGIVLFILIISQVEILLSYILAFVGREQIAEELSSQVVITCIGTVIAYCVKALVENISKYTGCFNKKNDDTNADNCDSCCEVCDDDICG